MTCRELVELVTDYLEGRLPDATRQQLEEGLDDLAHPRARVLAQVDRGREAER